MRSRELGSVQGKYVSVTLELDSSVACLEKKTYSDIKIELRNVQDVSYKMLEMSSQFLSVIRAPLCAEKT